MSEARVELVWCRHQSVELELEEAALDWTDSGETGLAELRVAGSDHRLP